MRGTRPAGFDLLGGLLSAVWLGAFLAAPAGAQQIQGRVVDANNGLPVEIAGVYVLDRGRGVVAATAADTSGYYTITAPGAGEYYLAVQRIGYFENETPLFEVGSGGTYTVDFEMRPEPFRLDPLEVTVRNEELVQYLTLELGMNPYSVAGFRSYQGTILARAKQKAHDNTDLLRELYIPVEHGMEGVCVGSIGMALPERASGSAGGARRCGSLYVDDVRCPNEHIEAIDRESITAVVVLRGSVRLYTRGFDWTFRPAGRTGTC